MTLFEESKEQFVEAQRELVEDEIQYWERFRREHPEGAYYPFWIHHRDGQVLTKDNQFKPEHEESLREYIKLPDVMEVNSSVLVDLQAIQIPFNCFWKSCRLTGSYCCISRGPSNTDTMIDVMQNSGRRAIQKFKSDERAEMIKMGNTHTNKLQLMKRKDGLCIFGEEEEEADPETGDVHKHVSCRLHELAIEEDIPLHDVLGFGPTLFPADVVLIDGQFLITAASKRAKENYATRWYVTSDTNPCTTVGDPKPFGILQNPSMDALFRRLFGDQEIDYIQEEAYGEIGPVEPEIEDGWIRSEERGLHEEIETCPSCGGDGCGDCDQRGWFKHWLPK